MPVVQMIPLGRRGVVRRLKAAGEVPPVIARPRHGLEAVPAGADARAPKLRWQHGQSCEDPTAPRMPSSVARGVQALRDTVLDEGPPKSFLIDDAEVEAARRFYEDYVRGVEGVREPSLVLRSGSADAHDVAIARAMAVGRHREIAELLGTRMTAWLIAFVVEELTFVALADRYWPSSTGRREMRGAMATMLLLLSRLYAGLDRRRKKDPR